MNHELLFEGKKFVISTPDGKRELAAYIRKWLSMKTKLYWDWGNHFWLTMVPSTNRHYSRNSPPITPSDFIKVMTSLTKRAATVKRIIDMEYQEKFIIRSKSSNINIICRRMKSNKIMILSIQRKVNYFDDQAEWFWVEGFDCASVIDVDGPESILESVGKNIEKTLRTKSKESGIPYSILKAVFERGEGAWHDSHHPGTTPEQWGFARVGSFIKKGKGTWGKADADLADKVRKLKETTTSGGVDSHVGGLLPAFGTKTTDKRYKKKTMYKKRFRDFREGGST